MDTFIAFLDNIGFPALTVLVQFIFGYLIIGNIIKQLKVILVASRMDNSLVNFVLTLVKFALLLGLILICLSTMNIPITGIVSAISAATLAIGLALKDILSSVANGIMLVINCPFKQGDYVEIGSVSGSIKELKLLHTVLTTPDNRQVMIPNSQVFATSITNYSTNKVRRMDLQIDIDYDEDPENVRNILLDLAKSHPMVLQDPTPVCHYNYAKDSSINFFVRVWVKSSNYWTVNWDLNEQLTKTLMDKGIQIPYPQVTVSYRKEEGK